MATTFNDQHKAALRGAGATDQHIQQLQAAGVDGGKLAAALPQIQQAAVTLNLNWQAVFQFVMQILPLLAGLFTVPTPGPTPVQPAQQSP
jgi:hypothetical protein